MTSLFFTNPPSPQRIGHYHGSSSTPVKNLLSSKALLVPTLYSLLALFILCPSTVLSETIDKNKMLKIEAAYLYKFTKFIQWPDHLFEQSSNLNICLLGNELAPLNRLLSKGVSGKQSNGRTLQIYHYQTSLPQNNDPKCHLVYLDTVSAQSLEAKLNKTTTLLISSPHNEHKTESLIYLDIQQGKLVFFINQQHLDDSQLDINAALLSLARKHL